jgi:hypothetical protein
VLEQNALAAAGAPDDDQRAAFRYLQIDPVQHLSAAETLVKLFDLYHFTEK